jgi:hypothetical protein
MSVDKEKETVVNKEKDALDDMNKFMNGANFQHGWYLHDALEKVKPSKIARKLADYVLRKYDLAPEITWDGDMVFIREDPETNKKAEAVFKNHQHDSRFNFVAPSSHRDHFSVRAQIQKANQEDTSASKDDESDETPKQDLFCLKLLVDEKIQNADTVYIFTAEGEHFNRAVSAVTDLTKQNDLDPESTIQMPQSVDWQDGICDCHSTFGSSQLTSVRLRVYIFPLIGCSWCVDLGTFTPNWSSGSPEPASSSPSPSSANLKTVKS